MIDENEVNQDWYKEIDLLGKGFDEIPDNIYEEKKALLIRGCSSQNLLKNYEKYSLKFGEALEYNNKNYKTLSGINKQAEIEYHTDGVSCLDPFKVPKFLFFLVENWPINEGGDFKLSYIPKMLNKLPTFILDVLEKQKLQFFNYFEEHAKLDYEYISFEKKTLEIIGKEKILSIFLPIDDTNIPNLPWKYKMKFANLNFKETLEILNIIKNISKSNDCERKIALKNNDVLFVDNRYVMHGRLKFNNEVNRCLHRIQILHKNNTYDL